MTADRALRLTRLAAEVRAELARIERTVDEIEGARVVASQPDCPRLSLYGAAALLETFYTAIEKTLTRIASAMGGVPDGSSWHRLLLDDATLDLPKVRPPVLRESTARLLEPYLAFRHRFRNLYLFDLDARLVLPLLSDLSQAWTATAADLGTFALRLDAIAEARADGGELGS